jgi:hypothetical protein
VVESDDTDIDNLLNWPRAAEIIIETGFEKIHADPLVEWLLEAKEVCVC